MIKIKINNEELLECETEDCSSCKLIKDCEFIHSMLLLDETQVVEYIIELYG